LRYISLLLSSYFILFACQNKATLDEQLNEQSIRMVDSLLVLSKAEIDEHPDLAYKLADSAYHLAAHIHYPSGEANALNRKGYLLNNQNKYDSAYVIHRKALEIRRRIQDTQGMGYSYANLVELFRNRGVWDRAAAHCDSAYWCFKQVGDTFQYIRRLQQRGVIALNNQGPRAALQVFLDYEQQARAFGNQELIAEAQMSVGFTYYTLGKMDSSYYYQKSALELHRQLGAEQAVFKILTNLSHTHARKGEISECARLIAEADSLYQNLQHKPDNRLYLEESQFILKLAKAGSTNLIPDFEDYMLHSESYYEDLNRKSLEELEAGYQLAAKEAQNGRLVLENQLFKIRNRGLLLAVLALLVLIFLMYQYFRNRKRLSLREMELKERHIKNVLQEQELITVNAALEGKDEERSRIARELHDRLGYILSLAKLNFSSLQDDLTKLKSENQERFTKISGMLDEAATEVRRISHDLYGSSVFNFGIVTALHQLADAVSAANKIEVRFHSQFVPTDLGLDLQVNMYRIVGELISNSIKHSGAGQIDIQLIGRSGDVILTYEDDGCGFNMEDQSWKRGMGYTSIEARLKKINGTYLIETAPGRGMYFQAEAPAYEAEAGKDEGN
jgi:signal transduction histidine kinase